MLKDIDVDHSVEEPEGGGNILDGSPDNADVTSEARRKLVSKCGVRLADGQPGYAPVQKQPCERSHSAAHLKDPPANVLPEEVEIVTMEVLGVGEERKLGTWVSHRSAATSGFSAPSFTM